MRLRINLLFIFFFAVEFSISTTTETPERTVMKQQIDLLKAKMIRLRDLKDLLRNSTLYRNWQGICRSDSLLRCRIVDKRLKSCICWNADKKMKVNWFTAEAFCDYHGMHLISFPWDPQTFFHHIANESGLNSDDIWTSANDVITRRIWIFRNGQFLRQEKPTNSSSIELDEFDVNGLSPLKENKTSGWSTPTTCISARTNLGQTKFYPLSCLEKKPFICEQLIL